MKRTISLVAVAVAVAAFFTGCNKSSETPPGTPPPQAINATEFRPAFATASPEIKAAADQVMMNIQSSMFQEALSGLAKLSANPALTEAQKKSVADLTEQVKKKIAAIAAPPN